MDMILDWVAPFLPLLLTTATAVFVLWLLDWWLLRRHPSLSAGQRFPRQLAMLAFTIVAVVLIALSLPVSESSRNQVVALIGLLLSGIFAISSTSVVSNMMAGALLRFTKPFRTGDFIRVGEFFGRVSEPGIFDTEIQSESRELIALPNSYLVALPITTTQESGAIISANISLGYDVHHKKVNRLLLQAAEAAGLESPYVHVIELMDHAVAYRVSGLLKGVKGVLTARSRLHREVLDALHHSRVEIVSPSFMNQRRPADDYRVLPQPETEREVPPVLTKAEDIVFDKAEQAHTVSKQKQALRDSIVALTARLESMDKDADEAERLRQLIEQRQERLAKLESAD